MQSRPFIIDDHTPDYILFPHEVPRGLEFPEHTPRSELRSVAAKEPFPQSLMIPESEWEARIRERQERGISIRGLMAANGIQIKRQTIGYCWIFAPTLAVEIARVQQGHKHIPLSPASAGAYVKNFRNVGGWGHEALDRFHSHGLNTTAEWPDNSLDRRLDTPANREAALKNRVPEWWHLPDDNFAAVMSVLLRNFTCPVGFNWWGHEVLAIDPLWIDGGPAYAIANSWGPEWGDQGFGVLRGRKAVPQDAVVPRTVLPRAA
jgi:hypothetical protein